MLRPIYEWWLVMDCKHVAITSGRLVMLEILCEHTSGTLVLASSTWLSLTGGRLVMLGIMCENTDDGSYSLAPQDLAQIQRDIWTKLELWAWIIWILGMNCLTLDDEDILYHTYLSFRIFFLLVDLKFWFMLIIWLIFFLLIR